MYDDEYKEHMHKQIETLLNDNSDNNKNTHIC